MTDQSKALPANPEIAKAQAKRLRTALAPDHVIGHSQALEVIARIHGEQSWGRLNSLLNGSANVAPPLGADVPNVSPKAPGPKASPDNHVEQRVLQALWHGLKRARDTQVSPKTLAKTKELQKDEIIATVAIEGWLDTLDVALGGMIFDMGTENLDSNFKCNG